MKNLKGQKFERLTVLEVVGKNKHGNYTWKCLCDCGNETVVASGNMVGGGTKSCGCLQSENRVKATRKHGKTHTTEYNVWAAMKRRCYNKNVKDYPQYGGRGIKVCDRWLNSFENFLFDMGFRPTEIHSVDRKKVNEDYTPDNCKWSTPREQAGNRRSNHWLVYNGKTMILADWSRELNVNPDVLLKRFKNGLMVNGQSLK